MKKVLWLASWYPSKADKFTGDFVQRHALSVSAYQKIVLIFVVKDIKLAGSGKPWCEIADDPNLEQHICYYPQYGKENHFISKLHSVIYYFYKHLSIIKKIASSKGLPDIVHVQIAMKAGLIALYLKWRYKIPYVLTENWTGYYDESTDNVKSKNLIFKLLLKLIFKNMSIFLPVTDDLASVVNKTICKVPYKVIPNVVDTTLFQPRRATNTGKTKFIHVSTLTYQKNVEGILRSFSRLLEDGHEAELIIIGPLNRNISGFIEENNIVSKNIIFTGEIEYAGVAEMIIAADVFVLFSRFENLPCVILESLCCGLPVIATDVGGIREVIKEDNGLLIASENEEQLFEAMKKMVSGHLQYKKGNISNEAISKFSYQTVGRQYIDIYDWVLSNRPS